MIKDTIVISLPGTVSEEAYRRIQSLMAGEFPQSKAIVLEQGARLDVIESPDQVFESQECPALTRSEAMAMRAISDAYDRVSQLVNGPYARDQAADLAVKVNGAAKVLGEVVDHLRRLRVHFFDKLNQQRGEQGK